MLVGMLQGMEATIGQPGLLLSARSLDPGCCGRTAKASPTLWTQLWGKKTHFLGNEHIGEPLLKGL